MKIVSLGEVPTVINTKWHKMAACFYWNLLQDCMAIDSSTLNRHKQWFAWHKSLREQLPS